MTDAAHPPLDPRRALREAWMAWGASFALIVGAFVLYRPAAKAIATAAFLYLPLWVGWKRGEDARDFGLRFDRWREDLALIAKVLVVLVPVFFLVFYGFVQSLRFLPPEVVKVITPLRGRPELHFGLPRDFHWAVIDQLLVTALPEELFYRGFLQSRLRVAWPEGTHRFGITWGRAFWVTAALFAVGHLAVFQVWRLAVFFPAILFGWMRERTGTVMGAAFVHAFCNLYELVLERSLLP